jgi:hypothetical protein
MPNSQTKCAHAACTCNAAEGGKYCSSRCEELRDQVVTKCPCGHAACTAKATAGAMR